MAWSRPYASSARERERELVVYWNSGRELEMKEQRRTGSGVLEGEILAYKQGDTQ